MILLTNRLTIRPVAQTDLESIHALHSLPETDEFNTLGIPGSVAVTLEVMNSWLAAQQEGTSYVFCIAGAAKGEFIGLIGLNRGAGRYRSGEVWYKLHVDHWRKGYATEALRRILDFGFKELQLHRIEAGCAVENTASAAVLEKAGMTREGRKRKNLPIRGTWQDNYLYAILDEDFLNQEQGGDPRPKTGNTMEPINIEAKLALFSEYWNPKIVGALNGQHVKLVKFKGEFVWHKHDAEDELFLVVKGSFRMEYRDRVVTVKENEFVIVPRGTEHRPVADEEVSVMLFEPESTLNTGDADSERARHDLDRI